MTEGSDQFWDKLRDREEASSFRFRALSELFRDCYDLQIFQQRPMREESLRGLVLSCPGERILCGRSVEATRELHRFYDYIGERAVGMNEMLRRAAIWTKRQEMTESIGMVGEHLPDSADVFTRLRANGSSMR